MRISTETLQFSPNINRDFSHIYIVLFVFFTICLLLFYCFRINRNRRILWRKIMGKVMNDVGKLRESSSIRMEGISSWKVVRSWKILPQIDNKINRIQISVDLHSSKRKSFDSEFGYLMMMSIYKFSSTLFPSRKIATMNITFTPNNWWMNGERRM